MARESAFSAEPVRDELRQAFRLLPDHPRIGTTAADETAREIRRLFLRGTRYFIYYSVRDEDVEILRLWHASRGAKPRI